MCMNLYDMETNYLSIKQSIFINQRLRDCLARISFRLHKEQGALHVALVSSDLRSHLKRPGSNCPHLLFYSGPGHFRRDLDYPQVSQKVPESISEGLQGIRRKHHADNENTMSLSNESFITTKPSSSHMEPAGAVFFSHMAVVFKLVLSTIFAVTGMCSNVINAAVFFKMGLSDGVSQNFFVLSLSDWLYASVSSLNSITYVLIFIVREYVGYGKLETEIQKIHWVSYYIPLFPVSVSAITTAAIAVVRCCSVAMPLKVKYVITARRQLTSILILSGSAVGALLFSLSSVRMAVVPNPQMALLFYSLECDGLCIAAWEMR